VFVYHQGGGSFSKVPKSTRELLKRNKKQLERKFGFTYRPRHPRDRQLDLIESYLERIENSGFNDALAQKIMNRLRLVEGLRPRGFLKRIRFDKRLNLLRSSFMRYRQGFEIT